MPQLSNYKNLPQVGVTSLHRSLGSAASMRGNTFMDKISQERIKELFDYNEEMRGLVYKKRDKNANYMWREVGSRVGYNHKTKKYRIVRADGRSYKEHILVWVYFYGKYPSKQIDHKNRIKDDNRIDNLRLLTGFRNQQNRGKNKNNTSGYKGFYKKKEKWCATIMSNRISYVLGLFDTPKEAGIAYNLAAKKLHGKYAVLNEI
jgi:hypothetical protein